MSTSQLRFRGHLLRLAAQDRRALLERNGEEDDLDRDTAAAIIDLVRHEGDSALRSLTREYDQVSLKSLEVERYHWDAALSGLSTEVRHGLESASARIEGLNRDLAPTQTSARHDGVLRTFFPVPFARVGVYAARDPGFHTTAVLTNVLVARAAGVTEFVVCSPPSPSTGRPSDLVLACCALVGVGRVFAIGGAAAIAAMARGTQSVPRVDRIVGAGDASVNAAKRLVSVSVSVDAPSGPPDVLVIADDSADATTIALTMIAQAEHGEMAAVVVAVTDAKLAEDVEASLDAQVPATARASVVRRCLARSGGVIVVDDTEQLISFANAYAAERVLLHVRAPDHVLPHLRTAGLVFCGPLSSAITADYLSGAGHSLPLGGVSRSYSGLSPSDFVRWTVVESVESLVVRTQAASIAALARAEGLDGHARVAESLLEGRAL